MTNTDTPTHPRTVTCIESHHWPVEEWLKLEEGEMIISIEQSKAPYPRDEYKWHEYDVDVVIDLISNRMSDDPPFLALGQAILALTPLE